LDDESSGRVNRLTPICALQGVNEISLGTPAERRNTRAARAIAPYGLASFIDGVIQWQP